MLLLILACAFLSGTVHASIIPVNVYMDGEYNVTVITFPHNVTVCRVEAPSKHVYELNPQEKAVNKPGDKIELRGNDLMSACMLAIKDIDENDNGVWKFSFEHATGSGTPEFYNVTVNPRDISQESDEYDEGILWLNQINHYTRIGNYIDVTLSKISQEEECYVRVPNGEDVKAADLNIDGVKSQDSSEFVSCRITIGPMEQSLLGTWTLCGRYTDGEEHERCQSASISWNNNDHPDSFWSSTTQPLFDHVVNFGGTLTPVVVGFGNAITCHVITPNGEDLVLDNESKYPSLKRVAINDNSVCSVAIGPIKASLLGNWTIYGKFRNAVTGLTEERLPMHLFLYDEVNPYEHAYNITRLTENHIVNFGNMLTLEVTGSGVTDSCEFTTPSGHTYNYDNANIFQGASFVDVGFDPTCRVSIGPITEELIGDWQIIGKFSHNSFFDERQHTIRIIKEDPANPVVDENRTVHDLNEKHFDTAMGQSLRIVIYSQSFVKGESCHIRTPNGLQYILREGFNIPGIEIIKENLVECGVNVNVTSEDFIGNWTLIWRAARNNEPVEWRLPFTVYVEEHVDAIPREVIINQGNDLYIRLRDPTDLHDTCRVVGPNGSSSYDLDAMHTDSCGYVIKNVDASDNGSWKIVFGHKITYIASIEVNVSAGAEVFATYISLLKNRPVEQVVGPENAVYCRLEDPQGFSVFDGFGRCKLVLEKVTMEHHGVWKMLIGSPGKVLVEEHKLNVYVKETEEKPIVVTHVQKVRPNVFVSCSVSTQYQVRACKFRDPHGRILLANQGVGEDRYVFHDVEESYESSMNNHSCGIRITNPLTSDLGLWRCAIQTEEETYYGFLGVLCPWALQDPEVAASVITTPTLTAERQLVEAVKGESVTMSCSVQAAIRYCHFRNQNGTVFLMSPRTSTPDMEYVGAGFDAGECGVRFNNFQASSSGQWSCAVGLTESTEEQRVRFQVHIKEKLEVFQYSNPRMVLEGIVYERRPLEYCRFVRIDGFGFSTDDVPFGYSSFSILTEGKCLIRIWYPNILDHHPWAVVVKIRGQDEEISRTTSGLILPQSNAPSMTYNALFYFFLATALMVIFLGICMGPKKNREWTQRRASAISNTLRNSFRKQPKNIQIA